VVELEYGKKVIALPGKVAEKLNKADEACLKFILALLSKEEYTLQYPETHAEVCTLAGISEEEGKDAFDFWSLEGVLRMGGEPSTVRVKQRKGEKGNTVTVVQSTATPYYSGKEIEELVNSNKHIAKLADECQKLFGMFGRNDFNKFISLIEYLHLDHDYILLLFTYCKSIGKTTVHFAEKTAYKLHDAGILTLPELEEYINEQNKKHSMENTVRKLFGIGSRKLSSRENNFVELWAEDGVSEEFLKEAYDIAVDTTREASMPYINKILSNWKEAGYTDIAAVREANRAHKEQRSAMGEGASHNTDEFFEAALRRTLERGGKNAENN